MLKQITPVILTYDEEDNIARCLDALDWAEDIVVVDSGSQDATLEILKRYPKVRVFHRPFDSHAQQWTYAVHETSIQSEWVLRLDADYILNTAWTDEVAALMDDGAVDGYETPFRYAIHGQPLRASLYPPKIALGRRSEYELIQDGHTEWPRVRSGKTGKISATMDHDDRKPVLRFLWSQGRYMARERDKFQTTPNSELDRTDRIRKKIFIAPWLVPLYLLFIRGLILDGRAGLFYVLQRTVAECVLSLLLLDDLMKGGKN